MIQLKNSGANVFFNITTPKFAAQAIKKAAEIGWKPAHYLNNVSASVGTVMKPAGFENAQGIITAPTTSRTRPTRSGSERQGHGRVEGLHGEVLSQRATWRTAPMPTAMRCRRLLHIVLKQCGDDLTRDNVMKQAASLKDVELPMLLPGIKVNTSATRLLSDPVGALQRFKGETWELFGDDPVERDRQQLVALSAIAAAG